MQANCKPFKKQGYPGDKRGDMWGRIGLYEDVSVSGFRVWDIRV